MTINPTLQLAQATSDVDDLQGTVADFQQRYADTLNGLSDEDPHALITEMALTKAALGEARNQEAFWRNEVNESKEARKSQGDLGKA